MVGHAINGQQFVALAGDDARNVFLKFLFPVGTDQILAALNGKHHLDVNLGVGIGHDSCRSDGAWFVF